MVDHALNRGNARLAIFEEAGDFDAFLQVLRETVDRSSMRLLAYCVMPNHFHLILWPAADGDLSRFLRWLTLTHTQRWHAYRRTAGSGHVYQGQFRSFPTQADDHFMIACHYVGRNALRAGLVTRAEAWPWGSLAGPKSGPKLAPWRVERPPDRVECVNRPASPAEEDALRLASRRNQPFDATGWQQESAARLRLESTLRSIGRPRSPDNGTRSPLISRSTTNFNFQY